MGVGDQSLVELVRRIVSENPEGRVAGADNASDWSSLYDQQEADVVVGLLAVMAALEGEAEIRENQLHAIISISESATVKGGLLSPLRRLIRTALDDEQLDYLDDLGIQL